METLHPKFSFLSNFEVLELLKTQKNERTKAMRKLDKSKFGKNKEYKKQLTDKILPKDLKFITQETVKYLEKSYPSRSWKSRQDVAQLLVDLKNMGITKAERLQVINLFPITLVELVVCIDDLETRFPTPEDQENLIEKIKSHISFNTAAPIQSEKIAAEEGDEENQEEEKQEDFVVDEQQEMEHMLVDTMRNGGNSDDGLDDDHDDE